MTNSKTESDLTPHSNGASAPGTAANAAVLTAPAHTETPSTQTAASNGGNGNAGNGGGRSLGGGHGGHGGGYRGRRQFRDLTTGSIPKNLGSLAWPQVVEGVIRVVDQVADLVWAGTLGTKSLAGIGVAQQY